MAECRRNAWLLFINDKEIISSANGILILTFIDHYSN